eukprot:TRINITY_DN2324_c0_g1_i1.p1 TRINITY_DN2324_c0_g1~~TRINITY_DN2324_c0_g1_i1.p1  ORF type:complete len:963 (-),score=206.73 TRINITY_DN2324_c0_g1_i1:69-2957(-)
MAIHWQHWNAPVRLMIARLNGFIALFSGTNPYMVILFWWLFFGASLWLYFERPYTVDQDELWLAEDSSFRQNQLYWEEKYGKARLSQVIYTGKDGDVNFLENNGLLEEVYEIHHRIMNATFEMHGRTWNWTQICFVAATGDVVPDYRNGCLLFSPLDFWPDMDSPATPFPNPINHKGLANDFNRAETVSLTVPWVAFSDFGAPPYRDVSYGGRKGQVMNYGVDDCYRQVTDPEEFCSVNASSAVDFWYYTDQRWQAFENYKDGDWTEVLEGWDQLFRDVLDDWNRDPTKRIRGYYQTTKSFADWIEEPILDDLPLLMGAFLGIMFLGGAMIFREHSGIGFVGFLHVGLAWTCGVGFLGLFSIEETPNNLPSLFFSASLGIHHVLMYVIEFDREEYKNRVPVIRARDSLLRLGPSLFTFAVSSVLSFAFVGFSDTIGVRSYCLTMGVLCLFDYLVLISHDTAMLVLDIKRKTHGWKAFWPWSHHRYMNIENYSATEPVISHTGSPVWRSSSRLPINQAQSETASVGARVYTPDAAAYNTFPSPGKSIPQGEAFGSAQIHKFYTYFLNNDWAKNLTILVAAALISLAATSIWAYEGEFDRRDLFPDDSEQHKYYDAEQGYFREIGMPCEVIWQPGVDYFNPDHAAEMMRVSKELAESKYLRCSEFYCITDWFSKYWNERDPNWTRQEFYDNIPGWLTGINLQYERNIVLSYDAEGHVDVVTSKFTCRHVGLHNLTAQRDGINAVLDIAKRSSLPAFGMSPTYSYYEQFPMMEQSVGASIITTTLAYTIVTFLLVDPIGALFVSVLMWTVQLNLWGIYMVYSGQPVATNTMMSLVMTSPLAYLKTLHIVSLYVQVQDQSRRLKVIEAMDRPGKALALASLCSIISSSFLMVGYSPINNVFIQIFVVIELFAFFYGMFLLPILLLHFGAPEPDYSEADTHKGDSAIFRRSPAASVGYSPIVAQVAE